jgi:hypothetical protein
MIEKIWLYGMISMNKLSENDINILKVLEKNGVRAKNPITNIKLLDDLHRYYSMKQDEIIRSLEYLEEIKYIEGTERFISLTESFDNQIYTKRGERMANNYTLDQKKVARFKMLEKFYLESGGSEDEWINIHDVGRELNFPDDLNEITYQYLVGERLIEFMAIGGLAGITHYGIMEYESAVSAPENGSKYFPPFNVINNILNIKTISDSQVQVGSSSSTQVINKEAEFAGILEWVDKLEKTMLSERMNTEFENIKDEIDLIKSIIKSDKPNKKYLNIAFGTIRDLLIGMSSNAMFQWLLQIMPKVIP